ncbi:GNAT family N-acetyltransferase [Streptomyces sp. BJ20]|uniref:GNAT family N-acetyltransferase n=1 Tax=Streptomyces sp. BJ20 TaxID=2930049 RepID=UPI001FD452CE|nr:GNAT family N-acetyltransferase [Streptomyces sp. BJ20]
MSRERTGHDERIRPVRAGDWPGIALVEAAAYAGSSLTEGRAALEAKGRASPDTCFVVDLDGDVAGYLLALPYPRFKYPPLARADEPAHDARNLHLHDLVVAHGHRGRGWGRGLLDRLTAAARPRFEHISLVAVDGMAAFWAAHGYQAHPRVRLPESYGENAVYMSTAVPGRGSRPSKEVARFPCPVS